MNNFKLKANEEHPHQAITPLAHKVNLIYLDIHYLLYTNKNGMKTYILINFHPSIYCILTYRSRLSKNLGHSLTALCN